MVYARIFLFCRQALKARWKSFLHLVMMSNDGSRDPYSYGSLFDGTNGLVKAGSRFTAGWEVGKSATHE